MEQKPVYYDGSTEPTHVEGNGSANKSISITPEMRKNIGSNPYQIDFLKQK